MHSFESWKTETLMLSRQYYESKGFRYLVVALCLSDDVTVGDW